MKREVILFLLERLFRLGLGGLFIYSGMLKIDDPGAFADAVARYEVLPDVTLGIFSLVMPMMEFLAGVALVLTKWTREASLLISGMLALFIVALAQALARGLEISCGCFGVPSVGGRAEIVWALVRDFALIVPAAWLMFRRNAWLWKGAPPQKTGLAVLLALWAAPALALSFSRGPVKPGVWNLDFEGVKAASERERRPMVLMHVGEGCTFCNRLEKAASGMAFRLWREDRAPYMAYVRARSSVSPTNVVGQSAEFVYSVATNLPGYPYVCVYWPHAGATNKVAFCGRRGKMGVKKQKLLVAEFMAALDDALSGWIDVSPGSHKPRSEFISAATRKVSARADGKGSVTMKPASGLLKEGDSVVLTASPARGSVFYGWSYPDGHVAGWSRKLLVGGGMPGGEYKARFVKAADCRPPEILSPASTSLVVHAHERFRHVIAVSADSRPVKFAPVGKLPYALKLDADSGMLSGTMAFISTNHFEIAVIGNDAAHTRKTVALDIVSLAPHPVEPGPFSAQVDEKADDEVDDN